MSDQTEVPSSNQQTLTLQQALNLAVQHHSAGDLSKAESHYQQILQADPNQPVALHLLGVIAHQGGDNDRAVDLITKALTIKPDYSEAHSNLGVALQALGRLDEAVASYNSALKLNPNYAVAHYNMGDTLCVLNRLDEAIASCNNALVINPEYYEAYNNLGKILMDQGKLDDAVINYQKSLSINPDYIHARSNLGVVLYNLGRLEEALENFKAVDTPLCDAMELECLFALGRYDTFYEKQKTAQEKLTNNVRAAAISAFASQQLDRSDPHPFCPTPLDFIQVYENLGGVNDGEQFLQNLITELKSRRSIWEPPERTTKNGFQTLPDLFLNPTSLIGDLEQIIKDRIEDYRLRFSSKDCVFMRMFPKTISLSGWFVRLLKEGHQESHIHASGWLSGVLYLQLPNCSNPKEGSINFGLWGYNYPILNKNSPEKQYYPKRGDIILFPSSLFHRTIPFHSNEERMSIAFDLIPISSDLKENSGR